MSNNLAYLSVRLVTAFGAVKLIPWLSVKTVAIRGRSGCGFNGTDRTFGFASYSSRLDLELSSSGFGGPGLEAFAVAFQILRVLQTSRCPKSAPVVFCTTIDLWQD